MARGYPDFFGYSIFPWHGSIKEETATVNVAIGATSQIIYLAGKRVIYCVDVSAVGLSSIGTDIVRAYADGNLLSQIAWQDLGNFYFGYTIPGEFAGASYISTSFAGHVKLAGLFGVGQSFEITYKNAGANIVPVTVWAQGCIIL